MNTTVIFYQCVNEQPLTSTEGFVSVQDHSFRSKDGTVVLLVPQQNKRLNNVVATEQPSSSVKKLNEQFVETS